MLRWEELRPDLHAKRIDILTISTDNPVEIRMSRIMPRLKATMLADPTLEITDLFGVRNQNINNFRLPGRPGLPISITLIVDENGKVLWIDQSDDYSRLSDPSFVNIALAEHFN